MTHKVVVDWSPESPLRYRDAGWAVVAVDVIRASTTAITAVSLGHRCFPASSIEDAHLRAATLGDPVLAGEIEGESPPGFHMQNSPTAVARLVTRHGPRDVILLSTSGTRLMVNAAHCEVAYVAALRNHTSTVEHLARGGRDVAVLGAGSGGTFREEDQLCCALIAQALVNRGFSAGADTRRLLARWEGAGPDDFLDSDSVAYLRRTAQIADLRFIMSHVDDLDEAFVLDRGQVVAAPDAPGRATASG